MNYILATNYKLNLEEEKFDDHEFESKSRLIKEIRKARKPFKQNKNQYEYFNLYVFKKGNDQTLDEVLRWEWQNERKRI